MKTVISVTGAGGFIGSVLVLRLLRAGYHVRAIDRFFFGREALDAVLDDPHLTIVEKDIRSITPDDLAGSYALLDLAALSNDQSGDLDSDLTRDINENGRVRLAKAARAAGVPRHVMASSCAVYGSSENLDLEEGARLNPQTAYAASCARAEEGVSALARSDFSTTALRNATVYGLSSRMRFDLVVNKMTLSAFETGRLTVAGDGRQWRPLVHVQDVADAFVAVIEAEPGATGSRAFNVSGGNMRVREIADAVRSALPIDVEIDMVGGVPDHRTYHVSSEAMSRVLGFRAKRTIATGALEIFQALDQGRVENTRKTDTGAWYAHLLRSSVLQATSPTPVLAP